jgi:hypothetical protein
MKTFRIVAMSALALGLMLGASKVKIASAQGGVNVDDPAQATEINGAPHTLPGKSALWFRFDYFPFDDDGNHISCDTNQPADAGPCQSPDLTWVGGFNRGATYYVRVFNDNDQPAVFTLTIN